MQRFSWKALLGGLIAVAGLLVALLWIELPECSPPRRWYWRLVLQGGGAGSQTRFKFASAGNGHSPESNAYSFTLLRAPRVLRAVPYNVQPTVWFLFVQPPQT